MVGAAEDPAKLPVRGDARPVRPHLVIGEGAQRDAVACRVRADDRRGTGEHGPTERVEPLFELMTIAHVALTADTRLTFVDLEHGDWTIHESPLTFTGRPL